MRLLASLTVSALLLLGLAGVAQAGGCGCDETQEYAVLECKSTKKGGFEVFAFSNDGGSAPDIEIGEDCAVALNDLRSDSDRFFVDEVSTGTPDKTIYTTRASICNQC